MSVDTLILKVDFSESSECTGGTPPCNGISAFRVRVSTIHPDEVLIPLIENYKRLSCRE